jgi:hypothetical protein
VDNRIEKRGIVEEWIVSNLGDIFQQNRDKDMVYFVLRIFYVAKRESIDSWV